MPDFGELFAFQAGFAEMMVRGTVIYWTILILLRIAGRREVGSMGTADLLVLVLVADAAGDAMSAGSPSLFDGMVVIATIVAWSILLDYAAYYIPFVRNALDPPRVCLVRDGRIVRAGLRAEQISRPELMEQLRLKGIGSLTEVKRAYLESNGQLSVIEVGREGPKESSTLNDS